MRARCDRGLDRRISDAGERADGGDQHVAGRQMSPDGFDIGEVDDH